MNRRRMQCLVFSSVLSAAVGLTGCSHHQVRQAPEVPTPVRATSGIPTEFAVPAGEPNVRDVSLHIVADVKAVYFRFDSADLDAQARAALAQNANWLKSHPEAKAQAAGSCDERGTAEYNLALGQRRAQAVKKYYQALGVDHGRTATISYGEEKPVCRESNETCWRRNRRVDTLGALPHAVSQTAEAPMAP